MPPLPGGVPSRYFFCRKQCNFTKLLDIHVRLPYNVTGLFWSRPHIQRPAHELIKTKRGVIMVRTFQPKEAAQQGARLPCPHGHRRWPQRSSSPPCQGPQEAQRIRQRRAFTGAFSPHTRSAAASFIRACRAFLFRGIFAGFSLERHEAVSVEQNLFPQTA